ncbi:glycosyltransferase family 2 protein [Pedobacter hiemivivus]|uniref:Glycosyltransferase family 2 protein n=1 Tax=Pedobacter hiemivivus TaxID=2530454 RepID=A0A4R0NBK8_9SPHI|nr:glycosyltransferase family 2 protein [Pedobacter hiemivivus]TCC97565.1 glycosyltransferase family 2 protein [Pedobacter hiemivivus]
MPLHKMNTAPLISIALCTYNGSRFLEKQIMSILNQTYKNIELIVVDDCSTDHTFEIIAQLASQYPQIKPYRNSENLGFNKNFEKAITLSAGAYIAISDQDDIWLKDKLQRLIDHIGDKWLIFSNSEWVDEEENMLGRQMLAPNFELKDRSFKSVLFYNIFTGHTILFSRDLLDYILPIPSNGYYDWWMGFVALYHNKITYLNECLTLHRIHSTSVLYKEKNQTKPSPKSDRFKEISINLAILGVYKNLKEEDRKLIGKIHTAYSKKKYSLYLIQNIYKYYECFFPDLKKRKGLSKLNFAIKFSKGY